MLHSGDAHLLGGFGFGQGVGKRVSSRRGHEDDFGGSPNVQGSRGRSAEPLLRRHLRW